MAEVFHERLKSPIPTRELERRAAELQKAMQKEQIDFLVSQNITQYLCGCNRYVSDTTAENNYPQSTILPADSPVRYIACSGPPLDLYPPSHLLRIGKPYDAAPYFSPFNYTNTWEGQFVARYAKENNAKKIAIAGYSMFYWNYYETIHELCPDLEIVDASSMFDDIRAIKSGDELEFVKKSAAVLDKTMEYVRAFAHAGVREYELRSRLQQMHASLGGEEQIIIIASAPQGEKLTPYSSFFQNRTLQAGDQLYVRLSCSGPGGFFTTIGRLFCVDQDPTPAMIADWEAALDAQDYLASKLVPGADPQAVFADYNKYLEDNGYCAVDGVFAYGQGYDNVERPSVQPGETMKIAADMSIAINTSLVDCCTAAYCADSYIIEGDGAKRITKALREVQRTY